MAIGTLEVLMKQAVTLTADERRRLAAYLVERARTHHSGSSQPLRWRDIRGMAKPPLLGEDAQAWVTRTRREGDEEREQQLRGEH